MTQPSPGTWKPTRWRRSVAPYPPAPEEAREVMDRACRAIALHTSFLQVRSDRDSREALALAQQALGEVVGRHRSLRRRSLDLLRRLRPIVAKQVREQFRAGG